MINPVKEAHISKNNNDYSNVQILNYNINKKQNINQIKKKEKINNKISLNGNKLKSNQFEKFNKNIIIFNSKTFKIYRRVKNLKLKIILN